MSDERLKLLYEEAVSARAGQDRAACVSAEEVLTLVQREGSEADRLRILDHVMSCPHCHHEFEMLRAVEAARAERPDAARRSSSWRMAIAASLALVVGAGVVSQVVRGGGDQELRGVEDQIELVGLRMPAAGGVSRLVWRSVPGALSYRVEVLEQGGELVHSAVVSDTALVLPDSLATDPSSGYVWWVQASLADGSRRTGGPVPLTPSSR